MARTSNPDRASASQEPEEPTGQAVQAEWPEYDLVDDVVFDPPLTPEERRQRGVGIPIEERLEQIRQWPAEGDDGF